MDNQPKNARDNRAPEKSGPPNRGQKRCRSPDNTELDSESRVGDFQSPLELKFK